MSIKEATLPTYLHVELISLEKIDFNDGLDELADRIGRRSDRLEPIRHFSRFLVFSIRLGKTIELGFQCELKFEFAIWFEFDYKFLPKKR
ncbi:unnamed protein product [Nesidiocoris tenuis]|uniref:Uncharacterized protein n=1 Tax=Nesidiocoris tenuis TaxID=355587 RepID=A0A6H5H0S8_9HEMI|nr:unnamed protein product [Nesidiocoris tenuis]